jgi:cytochrome c5
MRHSSEIALGAAIFALALPLATPLLLAQDGELSGKQVVEQVCAACHRTGAEGAPKIGDQAAWEKRVVQGLSSLTATAIKGVRQMPPHGGNPLLTDTEIARGITYMVNQSGGRWIEPLSPSTPGAARSREEIVAGHCAKCHGAGLGGAPRIGDREAWFARLKPGVDALVRSAIHGHGGMPARGGMAELTDPEVRDAVIYMVTRSMAP